MFYYDLCYAVYMLSASTNVQPHPVGALPFLIMNSLDVTVH